MTTSDQLEKNRICEHVLSRDREKSLNQIEQDIFNLLLEQKDKGLTKSELKDRLGGQWKNADDEELRVKISNLRNKLHLFFTTDGKQYRQHCVLPRGKPGRHDPRPYRLLWEAHHLVIEAGNVTPLSKAPGNEKLIPQNLADVAFAKLQKDFDYSAMGNDELLKTALKHVLDGIYFLVEANKERPIETRVRQELESIQIPKITSTPAVASDDIFKSCQALIEYALRHRFIVNCESVEVAALATLLNCREKYGFGVDILQEDQSGRQVVLRLNSNDSADFVIAANAPFFLLGIDKALDYCLVAPIHAEEQLLLRKRGRRRSRFSSILVYSDSSAKEQFLNMKRNRKQRPIWGAREPWSNEIVAEVMRAKPIYVDSLVDLVQSSKHLLPGDFVIAWQPLSDGLRLMDKSLIPVSEPFHLWVSLFAHRRWFEGSLNALRVDFLRMFLYEWRICRRFRSWAWSNVSCDPDFRYYFGGGAGAESNSLIEDTLGDWKIA